MDSINKVMENGVEKEPVYKKKRGIILLRQVGNTLYVSGHGPEDQITDEPLFRGRIGKDLTREEGYAAARECAIIILGALKDTLGTLDRVVSIDKAFGLVNCAEGFTDLDYVFDGFSDTIVDVLEERGHHARTVVGTRNLPNGNIPVEIEVIVTIKRLKMTKTLFASGYGSKSGAYDIVWLESDKEGQLNMRNAVKAGNGPSFLSYRKQNRTLYSLSEQECGAGVLAWKLDGGKLICRNEFHFAEGFGLCHLFQGEYGLFGSCYGSGTFFETDYDLEKLKWKMDEGIIHAHWMGNVSNENYTAAVDLGSSNIWRLKFEETDGKHDCVEKCVCLVKGGPRQILDCGSGNYAVVCETSGEIVFLHWDEDGPPVEVTRKKTTQRETENYPGEACLGNGGLIFIGNRGADTISVFDLRQSFAFLGEWGCGGCWPRGIAIDEDNIVYAACQKSNALMSFQWNARGLNRIDKIELEGASCIVRGW